MYLRKIILEDVGPIQRVTLTLPFGDENRPKPLVLVGANGSGKSVALAFLANAVLAMQQAAFDNAEVQPGRVYKLRSPAYVRAGADYYHMRAEFDEGLQFVEWQLRMPRGEFESRLDDSRQSELRALPGWTTIPENDFSTIFHSFNQQEAIIRKVWAEQAMLYFPADRHELPAWLNEEDLRYRPKYATEPNFQRRLNRRFVRNIALKEVLDWILDVALDSRMNPTVRLPQVWNTGLSSSMFFSASPVQPQISYDNPVERDIVALLASILGVQAAVKPLISVGTRHQRMVGRQFYDSAGNTLGTNTLLSLSSGEAQLFTIFSSILMDYDKTGAPYRSMSDVCGIVLIDEADLHLHVRLQREVLPTLIKRFPRVQFIITTHSPLMVLGLERELGSAGFEIVQMPDGAKIEAEQFAEFDTAFAAIRESEACRRWVGRLQTDGKLLLTEGKTDALIIDAAWKKLFPGTEMPFRVTSAGADGVGGARQLNMVLGQASVLPSHVVGLFDRDQAGCEQFKGVKGFVADPTDTDVRKHQSRAHMTILLPVPKDRELFRHRHCGELAAWHLEIEHYFPDDLLLRYGLVRQVGEAQAGRPFELNDGPKVRFATDAVTFGADAFERFRVLFDRLRALRFID